MKKLLLLITIIPTLFISCSNPFRKEYNELTFTADIIEVKESLSKEKGELLDEYILMSMFEYRPLEGKTYSEILSDAKSYKKEKELLNEKIKENELLAIKERNDKGIWNVKHYVDEFGEATKEGYIQANIKGSFSNSATNNSKLNITFLITDSNDLDFQLYEYAGNNPVKSYGSDKYNVSIKDQEGKVHKLVATNYSDRLSFGKKHSKILHNIFLKGGLVKFSLYDINTPSSKYRFDIENAAKYEKAYLKLTS